MRGNSRAATLWGPQHGLYLLFVQVFPRSELLKRTLALTANAHRGGDVEVPIKVLLPHSAAASLGDFGYVLALLELKPKQVLHSKEYVAVFAPVCAGDDLTITTTLRDLYEQQVGGNPMGFVTIDVCGFAKKGEIRFEAQRVLAIRGGFPRR